MKFNSRIAETISLLKNFMLSSLDSYNMLCKIKMTNKSPTITQGQEPSTSINTSTQAGEPRETNGVLMEIFPPTHGKHDMKYIPTYTER